MSQDDRHVTPIGVEDLIEISLRQPDDFLKVRETLTRIGVSSRTEKKLYQSCHILHKRGKYYIVHFKELFALDGMPTNFSANDVARRNTITNLLAEWEMLDLVVAERSAEPVAPISQIKILAFGEKNQWQLQPKYNIGKRRY